MQPQYPRSFFALQLAFAQRIAARFRLSLAGALEQHTAIPVTIHAANDWSTVAADLDGHPEPLEQIYQLYLARRGDEQVPQPDDTTYLGRPLFGCFYYALRDSTTIQTHFVNNDQPGMRPLGRERISARRAELRRMFAAIRATEPGITAVSGHSWLYNLPAYTRLFPPSYTAEFQENPDGVLHQVVLWYQCFDRFWEVKPRIAAVLLQRVEHIAALADLRFCFPYQRLRTRAPIADFYAFYGLDEQEANS